MCEDLDKPLNTLLSNMAGPKDPWVFRGKKVDWLSIGAITPTKGPSIAIVSIHETVKITVTADKGKYPETKQLVERIVQELKQDGEQTQEQEETKQSK